MLTRDNLSKRRKLEDVSCLFCCKEESVLHLFFECAVAAQLWCLLSEILEVNLGGSFESIGQFWLSNKRHGLVNIITAAALWSLWKLRNDLCFQNTGWKGMDILLNKIAYKAQNWLILCPENKKDSLSRIVLEIKRKASMVLWLPP